MEKLQINVTTQEQSKRLLELGVPADSADCYYHNGDVCWSVGRLIQIIQICLPDKDVRTAFEEMIYSKNLIITLMLMIESNIKIIDFSKLEE